MSKPENFTILTRKFLRKEYIVNKKNMLDIAKQIGCTPGTIRRYLIKHKLKTRNRGLRKDLTNKKINNWLVLKRMPNQYDKNNVLKKSKWLCKCDCGKTKEIDITRLLSGLTKSCGCKSIGRFNGNYTGKTKYISKTYWSKVERSARDRNTKITINLQYIEYIYKKQNGLCALSKIKLVPCESQKNRKNWTASLDRIDSSKGYIKGNVQWVHKDINRMKWHYNQEYFIFLCKKITNNN